MPAAPRRAVAGATAAAVVLALLLSLAPAAQASTTLYACVKKNGTARLFSSKPKCRKGEKRLSWGIEGGRGPAGANGINGAAGNNGLNGLDGAVAGYSAASEELEITAATEKEPATLIVQKLPAGSYQIAVTVRVAALDTMGEGFPSALGVCTAGYAPTSGPGETGDRQYWFAPISGLTIGGFVGLDTDELWFPASSAAPATVTIWCWPALLYGGENKKAEKGVAKAKVLSAKLLAIQTSRNVAG